MEELKKCSKCKIDKLLSLFYNNKRYKDNHSSYCKDCHNKNVYLSIKKKGKIKKEKKKKERTNLHKGVYGSLEYQRSVRLYNKYGLSLHDYDNLLVEQKDSCYICLRHKSEFIKPLAVDHDHLTNKVRGLLCYNCNVGLGLFKDNIQAFKRAIKYLSK